MKQTSICILGDSETRLWGLSGRERLIRMIDKNNKVSLIDDPSQAAADTLVILLRADYLFDPRLLQELMLLQKEVAINASNANEVTAVVTKADNASALAQELSGEKEQTQIPLMAAIKPDELVKAYDPRLLKYDPPMILAVNEGNRKHLENELFNGSYKGITDFVTKWLWPVPARWAVALCVKYKFQPNHVTLLSVVLAVLAGLLFWGGYLIAGLIMGWVMTFLDTVDGKLARVTITSSKTGDFLDHGLDLIHPPLWYLAWGLGIAETWISSLTIMNVFWLILLAYIGGRLCEGAFELWVAPFRLFLWQPWDAYNRLITARRNPNLVILTISVFYSRPDIGLWLVLIWHVVSTLVLMVRIYIAHKQKIQGVELSPWLDKIDPERDKHSLEVRLFTRLP